MVWACAKKDAKGGFRVQAVGTVWACAKKKRCEKWFWSEFLQVGVGELASSLKLIRGIQKEVEVCQVPSTKLGGK